ncbi:MAG: threonine dehydratase [Alphaproteobacteria bacterium]
MVKPNLGDIERAQAVVARFVPPTPSYAWPLLALRCGCEVWVKHENHTRLGAFKVRGGLVYFDAMRDALAQAPGVVSATRGNHGQSVAYAARASGVRAVIVVPDGNSVEKNAAMRALGAELVVHGADFQAALEHAQALAAAEGLRMVPSFDPRLVAGVATYAMEFFGQAPSLDTVYVPIGLGSGICGVIAARDALGLKTEVVGVVAEGAPAYALSHAAGAPVSTDRADTMADGIACRVPVPEAVSIICAGAARIVQVSDAEIRAAMRHYFMDTHNLAEGAGAAPLAALLRERDAMAGRRIGLVLSGGNVDLPVFRTVLAGEMPADI